MRLRPSPRLFAAVAAAAWVLGGSALAASLIVPATPVAFEPVHLRMTVDSCAFSPSTVRVENVASVLRITQQPNACLLPGAPRLVDVRLGELPAGDYRVDIFASPQATGTPLESLAFAVVPPVEIAVFPPPPRPLADYTGLWWAPEHPGWGLSLHQSPLHALFGGWFVFADDGLPVWYSLQGGRWLDSTTWTGMLYRTTSTGPFDLNPYPTRTDPVGTATLHFQPVPADGTASLITTIGNTSTARTISRLRF